MPKCFKKTPQYSFTLIDPHGSPFPYAAGIQYASAPTMSELASLEIEQLATSLLRTSDTIFPQASGMSVVSADCCVPGLFTAGTFIVSTPYLLQEDRFFTNITFTAGADLETVQESVNKVQNQTGMRAQIIPVGDPDILDTELGYRLALESTKEGLENAFMIFGADTVFRNIDFSRITPALDAVYRLNGEQYTSPSNNIANILPNVDIHLLKTTTAVHEPLVTWVHPIQTLCHLGDCNDDDFRFYVQIDWGGAD